MTDITIPPSALEKAAQAQYQRWRFIRDNGTFPDWDQLDHSIREGYRADARAACLAMLRAWPGMTDGSSWQTRAPCIILPLPEEPTNDK